MELQVETYLKDQWQVVKVSGEVDSKTVGDLRDFLDQEVKGQTPIALDLSGVSFMSSAGLRTLLTLYRQTEAHKVPLALVALQRQVADTMKVTGFFKYFTVYESISDLPQTSQ
ncbi:STAS domain-containing protein [Cyanobium sp. CH-040]|uniref:STAS domain-containing protein n=1 Tax=Cyanobium sp. CH-040 TaxID=2823708 RepID=UPI0037C0E5DE|nr:STAS domain-containing protein [Cyanobium sp. CH-040]